MYITIIKYWIIYYAKQYKIINYALNYLQFKLSIYTQKKTLLHEERPLLNKFTDIYNLRGKLGYIKSVLLNLVCCNASPIFSYNKN